MEIAIIGVAVSLLTQWLQKQFSNSQYVTLGIVAVVSLIGAAVYTYLVSAGYWESFYGVLVTAGAFYAFIISRFPNA